MLDWTVKTKSFCNSKQSQKKVFWKKSRVSIGINILISWLGLSVVVYVITQRLDLLWIVAMFLVAVIENLLLFHLKITKFVNHKQNQAILRPINATIDSEKLYWKQEPNTESTAPWSVVVNYFMVGDDIVLFIAKKAYWYLPRACFESDSDYQTILGHVKATIPIRRI